MNLIVGKGMFPGVHDLGFCYTAAILQVVSGIGVLISIVLLISGEKLGFGFLL
ncbi:hypothetical protein [Desulfosporosinus orientis]|nr:hypothetical protein [Desulfosporosinus orientis]